MEAGHPTSPGPSHHEDLWACHRCGWTYPNPHPSAKHRRNHKKHCGKIKGFEQRSEIHNGGSSDEASSDEEHHVDKGHLSNQSPQLLPEAIEPAALENSLSFTEGTGTVSHPVVCGERQMFASSSASDESRKVSSLKENMSDGFNSFKPVSPSPLKGEDSVNEPSPKVDSFNEWLDNSSGGEEKVHNPITVGVLPDLLQLDTEQKKDLQAAILQESLSKKKTSTAQEGPSHHEDLWVCHRCGWMYPNPHPSAKHRRNHKKHCGKIKGFELRSEIHNGGSSDEASSDEEHHVDKGHLSNPSPQLLPEAIESAVLENSLSFTEGAGTVSHPVVCGERQMSASSSASEESRNLSSLKENMSDGVNLCKPVSPFPFLKGEDSVIEPSPKVDTFNEQLDSSLGGEENMHNPITVGVLPDLLQLDTKQKKDLQAAMLQESLSKKKTSTAQEGPSHQEDLWACHRCGWTYPNPHPSAKHRRNHKKHCGKIKGFELRSEIHNGGSSDEASSDEDHVYEEDTHVSLLQGTNSVPVSEKHTGSTLLEENVSPSNITACDSSKISNQTSFLMEEASPSFPVEEKDASAKLSAKKDIAEHALDSEELTRGNKDSIVATGEGCKGIDTVDLSGEETDKSSGAFEPGSCELKSFELSKGGEVPVKEDICPLSENRIGDLETAAEELERLDGNLSQLPVPGQNIEFVETGYNNLLSHMPVSESMNAEKGLVKEEVSSYSDGFGVKKDSEVTAASVRTQDTEKKPGHSSEEAFYGGETVAVGLNNPPDEETGDILNNVDSNAEAQGEPDNLSSNANDQALSKDMSSHKTFPITIEGQTLACESAQIEDMNESKDVSVTSDIQAETKDQITESPAEVKLTDNFENMLHEGVVLTPDGTNKEKSFIEGIQQDNTGKIRAVNGNEKSVKEPETGEQIEVQDVHEMTNEDMPASISESRGAEIGPETSAVTVVVPGRSDSLETEMYEDAPENFETLSVGGSIDENEILDDSHEVADKKIEEQSQPFVGAVPQELSEKSIALKGQSNVLDPYGASTVHPENKVNQPSKLNFSGMNTAQDLKAPSPEAWQELGTSEVVSGNNETHTGELVQVAAPKSNDVEVKNHQISEKERTPLRSLLAKEVAGRTVQRRNSTDDHREGEKSGEAWGSHDVSKPKTRSIWSHCICCPAVH